MIENKILAQKNIENLIDLWKTASIPFNNYFSSSFFNYSFVQHSDWPNRLWFNKPVTQKLLDLANKELKKLPNNMTIPYWQNSNKNESALFEINKFNLKFEQTAMSLPLENSFVVEQRISLVQVNSENKAALFAAKYPKAFGYSISKGTLLNTYESIDYFLVYDGDQIIGTVIVYRTNQTFGIHGLGILPEMRKKGYAEEIMKLLINKAIENCSKNVSLQASVMGKHLYQKLGFQELFVIRNYVKSL